MDKSNAQVVFFPVQLSEFMQAFKEEMRMVVRDEIKARLTTSALQQASPKVLTIDEAADLIKLSKSRLYVLAGKGTIPNFKNGARVMFYEDEVLSWMESGRRHSSKEIDQLADEALIKK